MRPVVSNLNMDLSEKIVIETAEMDWIDSPLPGVQRRMPASVEGSVIYVKTGHPHPNDA